MLDALDDVFFFDLLISIFATGGCRILIMI